MVPFSNSMKDSIAPRSVGIIMDGNRRWAKERNLSAWEGHQAGKEILLRMIDAYRDLRERYGVAHYTFYAFSTENWKRSPQEVEKLLRLLEDAFDEMQSRLPQANEDGVRIRVIGDLSRFSKKMKERVEVLEKGTATNTQGTVTFALSYGGRDEIVRAVRRLAQEGEPLDALSEEMLAGALDTNGIPDPDLIIRTGGASRLSNFLTWQSAYSELMFTDTFWPDFTQEEFEALLNRFADIKRNFGA